MGRQQSGGVWLGSSGCPIAGGCRPLVLERRSRQAPLPAPTAGIIVGTSCKDMSPQNSSAMASSLPCCWQMLRCSDQVQLQAHCKMGMAARERAQAGFQVLKIINVSGSRRSVLVCFLDDINNRVGGNVPRGGLAGGGEVVAGVGDR